MTPPSDQAVAARVLEVRVKCPICDGSGMVEGCDNICGTCDGECKILVEIPLAAAVQPGAGEAERAYFALAGIIADFGDSDLGYEDMPDDQMVILPDALLERFRERMDLPDEAPSSYPATFATPPDPRAEREKLVIALGEAQHKYLRLVAQSMYVGSGVTMDQLHEADHRKNRAASELHLFENPPQASGNSARAFDAAPSGEKV